MSVFDLPHPLKTCWLFTVNAHFFFRVIYTGELGEPITAAYWLIVYIRIDPIEAIGPPV